MDEMIRSLNKYPNGSTLIVEWPNGCAVSGEIETIYETDTDLKPDNKEYQEFYVCLFRVSEILRHTAEDMNFFVGDLLELSMQNPPYRIMSKERRIIWENK